MNKISVTSQVFRRITMKVKLAKSIRAANVNKGRRFASEVRKNLLACYSRKADDKS